MKPLVRNALATVAGWIASHVVMFSAYLLNVGLYPDLMKAVEANDPALLQAEAAKPGASGALVIVLVASPFAFLPPALLAASLAARRAW